MSRMPLYRAAMQRKQGLTGPWRHWLQDNDNPLEFHVTINRNWATPLTIGSFLLLAVTGILMFFHLDTGLNKVVHEWLSWVLIAAVGLHIASNLFAFKRHFAQRRAQWLVGGAVLLLASSFLPLGGAGSEPPFIAPAKALGSAPLPVLAQVAGVPTAEMRARLVTAGLTVTADTDSVGELVGPETKKQIQILAKVLTGPPTTPKAGG